MSNQLAKTVMLDGASNFEAWHAWLKGMCKTKQCWRALTGETPDKTATEDQAASDRRKLEYETQLGIAEGFILLSLKEGPRSMIADLENGNEQYLRLTKLYKSAGYTARDTIAKRICKSTIADFKSAADYGESLKSANTELKDMGVALPEWLLTTNFLHGLGDAFAPLVEVIVANRDNNKDPKTGQARDPDFEQVLAQVIDAEKRHQASDKTEKALKAEAKKKRHSQQRKENHDSSQKQEVPILWIITPFNFEMLVQGSKPSKRRMEEFCK